MTVQAQNYLSITIAVLLAGINAITGFDPGWLGLTPVAMHWLNIVGIMLAVLQPFLRQVTPARLQGKEG